MWKRISIVTLSLFVSIVVFAQNNALEIRLVNNKEIELNPGSTFCVAVMLSNYTRSDQEFHLKIKAPDGWNQIMDYSAEEVSASTKKLKIFSFYAPDNAKVGDYNIYIEAYDNATHAKIGTAVVQVYIKPQYEIQSKVLDPPVFVFAGDTLSVRFLMQNSSNVRVTLKTTVVNNRISETRDLTMPPDASQVIRIFITTPKEIQTIQTQTVKISAAVMGAEKVNTLSSCTFKIIPSEKVKFDKYNKVPARISGMFATNNPNGTRNYGYLYNIEGGGQISPGTKKRIYFHFRGPNRQGNPVLGQTDVYTVKYSSPKSRVVAGDNSFSLTPLTEGNRLGRGVDYEHEFKNLMVGGFVNFPRFYPNLKRVIAARGGYFSGDKFSLDLGVLNKTYRADSSNMLLSVSGKIQPFKWNNIKFEYATGSSGGKMSKAYNINFKLHPKFFNLFVDYTRADPDFTGYVKNTEFVSSGISVALLRKLNLSANYNFNHSNMALDTMYSNAPYSQSMIFSLGYSFSTNTMINLSANKTTMEDMGTPKQFYYSDFMGQLSIMTRIKRIQVSMYSALGKTTNYLKPQDGELATKTTLNSNLTLEYRVNNHIDFSTFVSYLGGQQFINKNFKRYLYGGTLNAGIGKKFRMTLQYQNSFTVQELYKNRSLMGLAINYSVTKRDALSANMNYILQSNQISKKQMAASVVFTHLLDVPTTKRKDVGNLHGRIINDSVENIRGLRVTLAGNVMYTDKNGEFDFQNVRVGTHYLFVDASNAGYDAIAARPGPYKIEIVPGTTLNFELKMTRAAQIKGKVEVQKAKTRTTRIMLGSKNS